jgi:hypothetical protein
MMFQMVVRPPEKVLPPATVVAPASLERSNLQFFLRSITESPRHK